MDASKRVAKNTGILYIRMIITVFISLYATRLTLAALGTEDFGLFGIVGGAIAMLGFLNSSMAAASQRFMSFAQGAGDTLKIKRIFNMSMLLHIITAFFVLLLLQIAGHYFFNGILNIAEQRMAAANLIYQFLVISTVLSILSVPYEAIITAHENMFFYALLAIIESLLKLAIAIFITKSHFDHLVCYGFLMASLSILLLIFRLIYCHWHYSECTLNLRKYFDKQLLTQMTGFSAWSFLGSASTMISNYGQGIIINIFFGTAINAAQSIANQISGQLGVLSVNMLKALNPLIDKSAGAGDRNLMLKATLMGSKVSFFLVMALYIPAIIEMPFLLQTWLKNVPDFAVIFCRLLLIRNLIEHFFYPLVSAISAVGNIKSYQTVSSLITLFPLPISYFLFQAGYPAYSIYLVYIFYAMLASAIILLYSKKHCALSLINFLTNVLLRCGCSFLLVFSISYLPHYYFDYGNLRFITTLVLSIISYLIIVLFLGFSGEERSKFKEILAPVTHKFGRRKCLP
ncbi:hypothetical protein [Methylomonas sp. AM2-LC]|uniref:hypothetical protein n=1 Tax=Methylomonas sp. AM2-LC TaxID=3153301 RepID=UPI0032638FE7